MYSFSTGLNSCFLSSRQRGQWRGTHHAFSSCSVHVLIDGRLRPAEYNEFWERQARVANTSLLSLSAFLIKLTFSGCPCLNIASKVIRRYISDMSQKPVCRQTGLWAENGTRTRGLNLGKVALYQLSYFRSLPIYIPRHFSWQGWFWALSRRNQVSRPVPILSRQMGNGLGQPFSLISLI